MISLNLKPLSHSTCQFFVSDTEALYTHHELDVLLFQDPGWVDGRSRCRGREQRRMPTLGTLRLVFLFWRMTQPRVSRWVYSFWRLCFNITNKTVRVRNKIRDRYCFMRSCSREMVFLSQGPMLVSSKICWPLADSLLVF